MTYSDWNALLAHRPAGWSPGADDAGVPLAEVDRHGRIRHVNRPGTALWGWQKGRRVPAPVYDALRRLDAAGAHALPLRPGGRYLLGACLANDDGWLLLGYAAGVETVTESESDFKSLIENLPEAVVRMTADGVVVYANAAAAALTGRERLVGRAFEHAVDPEDRTRLADAWQAVTGTGRAQVHLRFRRPEGPPAVARMHLFRTPDGGVDAVAVDETEERAREEALFQSESLYRAFLEQSPVGMLHLDAEGMVTFENHPFRQIVGEGVEDAWIGLNIFEIPGLDPAVHPALRALLAEGTSMAGVEACFERGDGVRYLVVHGSAIRDPDGARVGAVLTLEDVTEARAREAAMALRDRYREAEAALRRAAVEADGEAAFLREAARLFGRTAGVDRVHVLLPSPDEGVVTSRAVWVAGTGRTAPLSVRLADLPVLRELARSGRPVLAGPGDAAARSLLALTGASAAAWVPFGGADGFLVLERIGPDAFAPGPDETSLLGHLAGIFETLWEALRVSARYRQIVADIDDGLFHFTYNAAGRRRYHFATPQFEALCGHRPGALVEGSVDWLDDVVHPADRSLVRAHDLTLRDGHESRILYRIAHADGTRRWVREHGTPREEAPGQFSVSGILTDVTEQKTAEEVLRQAKQEAEASNRLKTAFIATMSHEIRTPLGAVNGFAELLHDELRELDTPLPPQFLEFAEAIRERAGQLLTLVNDLFDLSNLEGGALSVQRVPVALPEVVRAAAEAVGPALAARGVALHLDLPPAGPVAVGDPERIRQVLDKLVANAVKFTEAGAVTLRASARGQEACLEVSDTGIGIDPDYLEALFTPFTQEEDWRTRRFEGTGLGLTMVKRLVDLMGGRIEVESRKGEGTTFRVFLPGARHTASRRRRGARTRG